MNNPDTEASSLLVAARERGKKAMSGTVLPPGLDHFTAYIGLVSSALELGKLMATEERDLRAIETHHEREMTNITLAFRQVEAAMIADFSRDESLKAKSFQIIESMVAAGQFEIALEAYKCLLNGFSRPSLEVILEHSNRIAGKRNSTLRIE